MAIRRHGRRRRRRRGRARSADGVPDCAAAETRGVAVRGGGGGVSRRRAADGDAPMASSVDYALWELRMRSHCMSHGFRRAYGNPEWAASPTALAEKPWVSEATRELLRTAPADALAPTPVPPLEPASGDWSAEQKAVASDAGETWADVMERANAARNQRRWGGGASELGHSDGWANLPSDVSFGGGGVGGGGGGLAAEAAAEVVEAVAGSREYRKIRYTPWRHAHIHRVRAPTSMGTG